MENVGALAILLAFCFSIYAVVASVVGKWKSNPFLTLSAERAVYSNFFLLTAASAILVYSLIAGDYRMTFIAEPCNGFPVEFARRTYLASIAASTIPDQPGFIVAPGSTFNLQLGGAEVLDDGFSSVGVAGSLVGLALYNDGYPFIIEKVAEDRWIAITGYALTSAAAGGIVTGSVPFDGWIAYHDHHPSRHYAAVAECRSAHHQLSVERR